MKFELSTTKNFLYGRRLEPICSTYLHFDFGGSGSRRGGEEQSRKKNILTFIVIKFFLIINKIKYFGYKHFHILNKFIVLTVPLALISMNSDLKTYNLKNKAVAGARAGSVPDFWRGSGSIQESPAPQH